MDPRTQRLWSGVLRNGIRTLHGESGHASKRRELAKGHTEEPVNGDNCKRGASQNKPGPTRIPMEIRNKEETPTSHTFQGQTGWRYFRDHSTPTWPSFFSPDDASSMYQELRIRAQCIRNWESDRIVRVKCLTGKDPGRSPTCKMMRARPKTEPRVTPRLTRNERPRAPRKRTPALLPDRKVRTKHDGRPRTSSLWKRAECQTEPKAPEKSMLAKTVRPGGPSSGSLPDRLGQKKNLANHRPTWSKVDLGKRDKNFVV